jgi:hypothetical protein
MNLDTIVKELRQEHLCIDSAREGLKGLRGMQVSATPQVNYQNRRKPRVSGARKLVSIAQKVRWAKAKKRELL